MPSVNLWQLITAAASERNDTPDGDRCREITNCRGPRFGTELSLDVAEHGTWTVEVFDHESPENNVKLTISPDGFLAVTRQRRINDVLETRTIAF